MNDTPEPTRPRSRGPYKRELHRLAYQRGYEDAKAGRPAMDTPNPAYHTGYRDFAKDQPDANESESSDNA